MKRKSLLAFLMALAVSVPALGQTAIGWWNFEDGTAGQSFYANGLDAGFTAREGSVDLSGNGYHMKGWDDSYGPKFSTDGATPTGYGLSAQFSGGQDGYCDYADLAAWSPSEWTIEFSFNTTSISGNKTIIGRDGQAGYSNDANQSALYVQTLNSSGQIRVQWISVSDELIRVTSTFGAAANTWYNVAITCDGTDVKFYVDSLDGNGYVEYSSEDTAITSNGGTAGNDHSMKAVGNWIFGQGYWGSGRVDKLNGWIDDVRLTEGVLDSADFLYSKPMFANPFPALGTTLVSIDSELSWTMLNADTIDHYNVFVSSDPNDWDPNAFETAASEGRFLTVADNTVPMADFDQIGADYITHDKTYKWRVDAYLTAAGEPVVSGMGSFSTAPDSVVKLVEPADTLANPTAELSVSASGAVRFLWYKEGVETALADDAVMTGTDSATLAFDFTDVETAQAIAYEGRYYCVMSNGLTDETTTSTENSASALLLTARLVGYWKFDGNLEDSVDAVISGVQAHDGVVTDSGSTTNVGDGIIDFVSGVGYDADNNPDDMAAQFTNDSDYITVPFAEGQEDVFNYYPFGFTYSMWYKFNGETNPGWRLPLSKLDAGSTGWLFGVDHAYRNPAQFIIETKSTIDGVSDIVTGDGQWHLITATYEPVSHVITLYTDGLPSTTATVDLSAMATPAAPLSIGGRGNESSCYGLIDELKIYSYPVTQTEIADELFALTGKGTCMLDYPSAYDFDGNCRIDMLDLANIAGSWLKCGKYPQETCSN